MKVVEEGAPAEGLMGIEVIAQQRDLERSVAGGVFFQPAFGGGDFAILLGVAVLGVMNSGRNGMAWDWPGATITGVTAL